MTSSRYQSCVLNHHGYDFVDFVVISSRSKQSDSAEQDAQEQGGAVSVSETCWPIAHKIQPGAICAFLDFFCKKKRKRNNLRKSFMSLISVSMLFYLCHVVQTAYCTFVNSANTVCEVVVNNVKLNTFPFYPTSCFVQRTNGF